MRTVVISGVSSGIGRAATAALVEKGFFVFGSVRREEDAASLVAAYPDHFRPLIFDVTDEAAIAANAEIVSAAIGNDYLAGLVNNAGIGVSGPMLLQPMSEIRKTFDVNLFAPIAMVRQFAGMLGADRGRSGAKGRVVNITSVAGRMAGPFLGAYCGSKHALEAVSDSMRRELMLYGIDVVVIGPGGVDTAIAHKGEAQMGPYDDTDFGKAIRAADGDLIGKIRAGHKPETIGRAIADALTLPAPKARYALVKNRIRDWTIPLSLPKRTVDRLLAKQYGLRPSDLPSSERN
ncbi:SDR family NAD(P)-dependent oxidoreductase [Sphingobium amiense]|uniref:SDR family NAD(P)-dependent oxidoreductase n=1 Tax=Sphingobium amiense TaxID=135719 RepID=A0A494W5K1_9SPHN|nr:SDR family NAD(P)-dependent oxidoreductase [Sphingobium amiense]BBD99854.1 SDR family NAD(P)-dependent oxidoreductase [Sphingobium amiense]